MLSLEFHNECKSMDLLNMSQHMVLSVTLHIPHDTTC